MKSTGSDCAVCAFKHLSEAKKAVEEFLLGWAEVRHFSSIIGDLGHAEKHLLAIGSRDAVELALDVRLWRGEFEQRGGIMVDTSEDGSLEVAEIVDVAREWIAKILEFLNRCNTIIRGDLSLSGAALAAAGEPHAE